jgi:hypothetical protein
VRVTKRVARRSGNVENSMLKGTLGSSRWRIMAEKFNPAPIDRHAADPKQAEKADKEVKNKLDNGLEGTFPASGPVIAIPPNEEGFLHFRSPFNLP